jgi:hypothetical protein
MTINRHTIFHLKLNQIRLNHIDLMELDQITTQQDVDNSVATSALTAISGKPAAMPLTTPAMV